MERQILKTFISADGECRVQVFKRPDGMFGFSEDVRTYNADGERCWTPASSSPICGSAEIAEMEARARIVWLRDSN